MATVDRVHRAKPPTPFGVVRLWDGRDHRVECVEAACPGLTEFARGRDCLEDSIPYDRAAVLLVWWKTVGLVFGVLALAAIGFVAVLDLSSVLQIVGAMAAILASGMAGRLPHVFRARHVVPMVRVRDGVVEVYRPFHDVGKQPMLGFRLDEARWHVGRVREDWACSGQGGVKLPDGSAIILRGPRKLRDAAPRIETTATGSTPEMVRFWRGFPRLAGVPEG